MSREDEERSLSKLQKLISDVGDVEVARVTAFKALNSGAKPVDILKAMSAGLATVGERYMTGEYFLSELIMAGIISRELSDMLKPYLEASATRRIAKVAIGTVKGDLHDIGKGIVIMMLSSAGYELVDLGVDVPAEKFVESVRNEHPNMVALSCLLTVAMDEMKNVIEEIRRAGLRSKVKVLVGGRPLTSEFAEGIGADGYGRDAIEAIGVANSVLKHS